MTWQPIILSLPNDASRVASSMHFIMGTYTFASLQLDTLKPLDRVVFNLIVYAYLGKSELCGFMRKSINIKASKFLTILTHFTINSCLYICPLPYQSPLSLYFANNLHCFHPLPLARPYQIPFRSALHTKHESWIPGQERPSFMLHQELRITRLDSWKSPKSKTESGS